MLKKRLNKIELTIKQRSTDDEKKMYIVRQNEKKNRMEITDLNFRGTIEDGSQLMQQYPNGIFVIFKIWDKDISDEEWSQIDNWAN